MPSGLPGSVNRVASGHTTIEQASLTPAPVAGHPTVYGVPMVIDATSGKARTIKATDASAYGVLTRPFPTQSSPDPIGTSTPPQDGSVGNLLRSGYVTVLLSGDAPAVKGASVYIWSAAATGSHIVGGFEAAVPTDGGSPPVSTGFQLGRATFQGPADDAGNVEIHLRF
jgi:hypothetical protein